MEFDFNIYNVEEEFIAAETEDEALQNHLDRIGSGYYSQDEINKIKQEMKVVNLDSVYLFESFYSDYGYEILTWREFIKDFKYIESTLLCWND